MSAPTVTLRGGKKLPLQAFGCGTALFKQDCTQSVQQAISAGFTFLDLAEVYGNSQYVGQALPSDSNKEGKVQILSKIHSVKNIRKAALEEREKLKISKFDALLLHLPPRGLDGNPSNVEAWKVMEQLKDEGVVESIGVSNWLASDVEEVIQSKPKHPIEINQIEYHPLIASTPKYKKLLEVLKREDITVMVYASLAPLTKTSSHSTDLHKVLNEIAASESNWTPGIVLQKWASQHAATSTDAIIASTSNKTERLKEYLSTFTSRKLTSEEVDQISKAGEKEESAKYYMAQYFDGPDE